MTGMGPGREPVLKKLFLIVASLAIATSASAEILTPEPSKACALLADAGLKGRKWVDDYGDGSAGCASDYKDIGSSSAGMANNLAYYVTGAGSSANEVKLVLNYNQPSHSASGTAALLAASKKLSQRALGAGLPDSVAKLIKKGEGGSEQVGKGVVEVVRDDWPTGKGYEVKVIMR